jgi:hypothetical protein
MRRWTIATLGAACAVTASILTGCSSGSSGSAATTSPAAEAATSAPAAPAAAAPAAATTPGTIPDDVRSPM